MTHEEIRTIISIISTLISIFVAGSTIFWNRKIRAEDKDWKLESEKYKREMDSYTKKLNKKNQEYIEKLNNKNELTSRISSFSKLSYEILMQSISCLRVIEIAVKKTKRMDISKNELITLIKRTYDLKEDLHVLRTYSAYLTSFLADKHTAIATGSAYNNLYFLVELLEDLLLKISNKTYTDTAIVREIIKNALHSSDELRKELDSLEIPFLKKLSEYNEDMGMDATTSIVGTTLFEWYFPEYPFDVQGVSEDELFSDLMRLINEEISNGTYKKAT